MYDSYCPIINEDGFLNVRWDDLPIEGFLTREVEANIKKLVIEVLDPLSIALDNSVIVSRLYDENARGKDKDHLTGLAVDIESDDEAILDDVVFFLKAYKGSVIKKEQSKVNHRKWIHFVLKDKK